MRTNNRSAVTSQRIGATVPRSHSPINTLTTASPPAPDMTSETVRAAQSKAPPAPGGLAKIEPAARAARAEVRPTKKRATDTQPPVEYRQHNAPSYREFGLSGTN